MRTSKTSRLRISSLVNLISLQMMLVYLIGNLKDQRKLDGQEERPGSPSAPRTFVWAVAVREGYARGIAEIDVADEAGNHSIDHDRGRGVYSVGGVFGAIRLRVDGAQRRGFQVGGL